MKAEVIFILLFFTATHNAFTQDTITDQDVKVNQQLWLDYNFSARINDNMQVNTQAAYRNISPKVYNRFMLFPTLAIDHQKPLSFLNIKKPLIKSFHAGAGVIYTQNYNTEDNFEFRLSQGFKFDIPTINQITLNNYFRIEERFQNSFTNSGFTSGFRLRYRVSTDLKLKNDLIHFTDHLYIPLGAEIFVNLKKSDRFNDLVRFYPGLGYQTKSEWKFELYLIYNRTKNITETSNSSNDFILRLRVYDGGNKTFLDKSNKEKNSKESLKDD